MKSVGGNTKIGARGRDVLVSHQGLQFGQRGASVDLSDPIGVAKQVCLLAGRRRNTRSGQPVRHKPLQAAIVQRSAIGPHKHVIIGARFDVQSIASLGQISIDPGEHLGGEGHHSLLGALAQNTNPVWLRALHILEPKTSQLFRANPAAGQDTNDGDIASSPVRTKTTFGSRRLSDNGGELLVAQRNREFLVGLGCLKSESRINGKATVGDEPLCEPTQCRQHPSPRGACCAVVNHLGEYGAEILIGKNLMADPSELAVLSSPSIVGIDLRDRDASRVSKPADERGEVVAVGALGIGRQTPSSTNSTVGDPPINQVGK